MKTVRAEVLNEKFPRIAKVISDTWGTYSCRAYILSLVNETRNGNRQGFPPAVMSTIIELLERHDYLYPQFDESRKTVMPFTMKQEKHQVVVSSNNDYVVIKAAVKIVAVIITVILVINLASKFF